MTSIRALNHFRMNCCCCFRWLFRYWRLVVRIRTTKITKPKIWYRFWWKWWMILMSLLLLLLCHWYYGNRFRLQENSSRFLSFSLSLTHSSSLPQMRFEIFDVKLIHFVHTHTHIHIAYGNIGNVSNIWPWHLNTIKGLLCDCGLVLEGTMEYVKFMTFA